MSFGKLVGASRAYFTLVQRIRQPCGTFYWIEIYMLHDLLYLLTKPNLLIEKIVSQMSVILGADQKDCSLWEGD